VTAWVFVLLLSVGGTPTEVKIRVPDEASCRSMQSTAEWVIKRTPVELREVRPCAPEVSL
jgi:hypothetical protein